MQQATGISFYLLPCKWEANVKRNFMFRFGKCKSRYRQSYKKSSNKIQIFFSDFVFCTLTIHSELPTVPGVSNRGKKLKKSYRKASISPNTLKMLERFIFKQIPNIMAVFVWKNRCVVFNKVWKMEISS